MKNFFSTATLAATALLSMAFSAPAHAIQFNGTTTAGASVGTDYSETGLISFDLDLADLQSFRFDYTLTAGDLFSPLSFNGILRNYTGTGLNDLSLTLGNGSFAFAGTVDRSFGGSSVVSLNGANAQVHFSSPEYLDTTLGNPLAQSGFVNWTIDTAGLRAGDALSVTVATPVPEPGTLAMMLAGMGLLGWSARRARR
ncbi:MAG: hypothetical protein RLZZ618_868 [Pseudomonadota bacterium]|jgi:hypothetical protein